MCFFLTLKRIVIEHTICRIKRYSELLQEVVFIAFFIGYAYSKSMASHGKVMLSGLLPIIALSTLLVCGTMQQQSALAFGVTKKKHAFL